MGLNKDTGVAFLSFVLLVSTWYHIRTAKQQNAVSKQGVPVVREEQFND